MSSFADFDLLASLKATLKEKELVTPTEIQARALPALLTGRSVVGVAETGSGKTLSYALPILHKLKSMELAGDGIQTDSQPRAAVIVPTRELGEQVARVFKPFTHTTRLRVRSVLGGTTMEVAKRNILGQFEILVATPGRLVQLIEQKRISLADIRFLVFDEADQMLDQGFLPDVHRIVSATTVAGAAESYQKALFSATVSPAVQKLMNELFTDAEVMRSKGSHRVVPSLVTKNVAIVRGKRFPVLEDLISNKVKGGTLIFTNTRIQCDTLAGELERQGRKCAVYRGEMDKVERRQNLKAFRDGEVDLLISTDLASRGLDIEHVGRVINYHMPQRMENYIHRVGRTARAGRKGLVINFITERDENIVAKLKDVQALDAKHAAPKGAIRSVKNLIKPVSRSY